MKLQAKTRDEKRKGKHLRKEDEIPAVLYGKGIKNVNLSINLKEFNKVFKESGESTVIDLEIENDGKKEGKNVLIYDVSFDPVSDEAIHADLYQVDMKKKVTTHVPLSFEGVSEAVKLGGILLKNMHEVEVTALPKDLPHNIAVDLTLLTGLESVITVNDLKVAEGVELKLHGEDVIASVAAPRTEEELAALSQETSAPDLASIKSEADEKKEEKAAEAKAKEE